MTMHNSVKILCQILGHSNIWTKKEKIYLIMYFFMAQVAQSRHQLKECLNWKDGHNRQLFTIFRKLTNLENLEVEKRKFLFKWNCRINGVQICWKDAMQYRYIGSGIEYYILSQ